MTLNNLRVLVTRPAHQQLNFINLLIKEGARGISLPAIEVISLENTSQVIQQLKECSTDDILIFISPNAVNQAHNLINFPWTCNNSQKIAAIGDPTAQSLLQFGQPVSISPNTGFSSKDLLALPEFQNIEGIHISIIRGSQGRSLLFDQLQARGARVRYISVYRTMRPTPTSTRLQEIFLHERPDVVCATSNQGILNLVKISGSNFRKHLLDLPLIVNSDRCRELAKKIGFMADIVIAKNPGDLGQLEGLQQWYSNKLRE